MAEQTPLPPGWEEELDDESGDKYYISPEGETQWERPDPPPSGGAAGNLLAQLQSTMQRGVLAAGLSLPPLDAVDKSPLPKMAELLPQINSLKEERPIRGKMSMSSSNKEQTFVYIPDNLVLGEKRDLLTAQKLLALVDLHVPELIFYVSSGDTAQTWNFRKPNGYDLQNQYLGGKKSDEGSATNLEHWRGVIGQKLTETLTNTAKSCNESDAFFCVDSSGYDAIGCYLASGSTKENTILSIAHGSSWEGTFHWKSEVMDRIRAIYTNGDAVEEADSMIGTVLRKKDPPIEFNDQWMDGDRLKWTSEDLGGECDKLGLGRDEYKHHPSSAATHYIICESPTGRKIIEDLLMKHVPSGEFVINGSYVGTARRVANAIQAERPLFVFQHTGGCADLTTIMLEQVKVVQRQFAIQEREAKKQGKQGARGRPRLEDLMSVNLPFDPFKADDPNWVVDIPAVAGRPKIQFTGVVGNIESQSQVELLTHANATFANFPNNAKSSTRLVIDPFVQRGAELQNLISRTMCLAGDGKSDELNGEFADANRLLLAWGMHGALTHSAEKQESVGTYLQAFILIFSFLTLVVAQLRCNTTFFLGWIYDLISRSQAVTHLNGSEVNLNGTGVGTSMESCTDDPSTIECQVTYYLSIVLPLLVTALLTLKGRFDPDAQVVELKAGAARIETEIYKYRTRTGPYGRALISSPEASKAGEDNEATIVAARDRFRMSITEIKDGLMNSVVTEHSMPRPMEGSDHTIKLKAEYDNAQKVVSKYMPGSRGVMEEREDKQALKEARQAQRDAERIQVAAAAAARGELPPGPFMTMINSMKRGNAVMPTPTRAEDDDSGQLDSDNGFGSLSAEDYVRFRTLPKLVVFSQRSPSQAWQVAFFEIGVIALSTGSALLGAFNLVEPVPMIVQLASVFTAWSSYKQMKISLKLTNSAVAQLERLVIWWQSLSMIEKRRPDKKEKLVRITEAVISASEPELAIRKQMDMREDMD